MPSWRSYSRSAAKYLRLPRDFYSDTGTTFHSAVNRSLMEYLVLRSPYAPCFTQTVDDIFEKEYVDLNCVGVSSELVIALGYILRDMNNKSTSMNWKVIRSAAPELPEFLSLVLAIALRDFYRGGSSVYMGYDDGTLIGHGAEIQRILDADPLLSGLDIKSVGGYVMNVTYMWGDNGTLFYDIISSTVRKHTKRTSIKGVLGSFDVNAIIEPRAFLLDLFNELKGSV